MNTKTNEVKKIILFSPFISVPTKVQRKIISFNVFLVYCEIIKLFVYNAEEVDFGRLGRERCVYLSIYVVYMFTTHNIVYEKLSICNDHNTRFN